MQEVTPNKNQLKAINHKDGPMLVVAGAGTGKTSVIVKRIAKLIDDGVPKSEILTLTFTEKAAQELLDRVSDSLHESYGIEIPIHTFNAFGQLLLREFAVEIGLSSNLKLVGDDGKVVFLREHLDDLGLEYFAPVSNPEGQLGTLADYFSQLKQQLVSPEQYKVFADKLPSSDQAEALDKQKHQELAAAYAKYITAMRARNTIDYDDQIYLVVELLEKRPNILRQLQKRYQYIMVDEFQDTNPMQSKLIDMLSAVHKNLMVVGDDDQAIYGWRGATLANILQFNKRYPGADEVTLIQNYRSTQEVLDSAWNLIQNNNPDRLEHLNKLDKKLVADRGSGIAPLVHKFARLEAELGWVADDINRRIKENKQDPGSIAVLGRSRRSVARIHEMLDVAGVDHVVAGLGEDLYRQPAVLMMVDALRAVWDPSNSQALYHTLAGKLFSCPAEILSAAANTASHEKRPLFEQLQSIEDETTKTAIKTIQDWHDKVHDMHVRAMSYRILSDSGLKDKLYSSALTDADASHQVLTLGQWFNTLGDFERIAITPSVHSYLENFSVLRAEGEILNDDTLSISPDLPSVMTIHKSKGLEWQTVYVIDCSASSFPFLAGGSGLKIPEELKLLSDADARLPEERRLMYVAATRARDELIITYAEHRSGPSLRKPSRFIEELGLSPAENGGSISSKTIDSYEKSKSRQTINLPQSMLENGNIVLTASQAEDYLNCPLNFYYKHVLCVPEQPGPQTAVGTLFHDIIQLINDALKNGTALPDKQVLLTRLETEWPKSGYSSRTQQARALKTGLASFDPLYNRLVSGPAPQEVEFPFRVHIPESKCILRGRIDAVNTDGESVEIHDYKTSVGVTDTEKAKRKTTESKQLTMYAVAWRILHGEAPSTVSLDFVQTGQVGHVKKLPRSLDTMEAKLKDAAEAILAGNFPEGSQHDYCIHPQ